MDSHSLIGTELGPCAIVQLLGQGSTGAVFLADHAELREQVAVKVVAPPASPLEPNEMASFLARFRRAASRAATLTPYKYRFFNRGRGHVPVYGVFVFFDVPFPFAFSSCSELKVWAVSGVL